MKPSLYKNLMLTRRFTRCSAVHLCKYFHLLGQLNKKKLEGEDSKDSLLASKYIPSPHRLIEREVLALNLQNAATSISTGKKSFILSVVSYLNTRSPNEISLPPQVKSTASTKPPLEKIYPSKQTSLLPSNSQYPIDLATISPNHRVNRTCISAQN